MRTPKALHSDIDSCHLEESPHRTQFGHPLHLKEGLMSSLVDVDLLLFDASVT